MKKKKRRRQLEQSMQQERLRHEEKRAQLPTVAVDLHPSKTYPGEYWWRCPAHPAPSFTYSKEINAMWGHPEDLVFCAVCHAYYRFNLPTQSNEDKENSQ